MQPNKMDDAYLHILKSLVSSNLRFIVMGTYGLRLHSEIFKDLLIKDCDLALENTLSNINIFIESALRLGWKVELWGQEVKSQLDYSVLNGKYYLRAKKEEYLVDATYELNFTSFETFLSDFKIIHGIPVASIKSIIDLKRKVGRKSDIESIAEIEKLLNQV